MGSSSKNPPSDGQRKGPNTLLALRESLIDDLRINQSADHAGERGSLDSDDQAVPEKPPHSSGMTATELPTDDGIERSGGGTNAAEKVSPSFARKVFRTVSGGVLTIVIVVSVLLSLDQDRSFPFGWLSSIFRIATRSSPDSQNQVGPTGSDFAVIRRHLEELGTKQDQIERDIATRQDQAAKTISEFALMRHQMEQLGVRQDQMTRDLAIGQGELKTALGDFASLRHQVEELGSKHDQIAAKVTTGLQDQLRATLSDGGVVRRQVEQLATKQGQMADSIVTSQEQLKNMMSDFALVGSKVQELAAKQGSLVTPADQLKTVMTDLAAVQRRAEELAVKQVQIAVDIANLQIAERALGQKIDLLSQGRTTRIRRHRNGAGPEKSRR